MVEGLAPTAFGRFILLKRIAAGGMGEVFLAKIHGPAGFEKLLIIKRILEQHADKRDFIDMFFAEAKLAAKLNHKNVAQIYEMGRIAQHYYLAMEMVHGRSLADLLEVLRQRNRPLEPGHVIDIISQACEGFAYAHNASDARGPLNLVHRDISPRNILLSYAGEVKLIDFGIAKSRLSLDNTGVGVIKGKLGYMSPEQSTARRVDRRSDIFSLGICLYELCSQRHPFLENDRVLTFDAIQRRDPKPLAHYDARWAPFDPIVTRALAKEPKDRYADCGALRRDLQILLHSGAVPMPRESLGELLHELFAAEIGEDNDVLNAAGQISEAPEPRPDDSGTLPPFAPPGWITRLQQSGRPWARHLLRVWGAWGRWSPVRLRVALAIVGIATLASSGASWLYAVGLRQARAAAQPKLSPLGLTPLTPIDPEVPTPLPQAAVVEPRPAVDTTPSERAPPEQERRRGDTPVAKRRGDAHGDQLAIVTTPGQRLWLEDSPVTSPIVLDSTKGRVIIGTGRDPSRDPFRVELRYSTQGDRTVFRLSSEPWAIVQDKVVGSGYGRTPLSLTSTGAPLQLELLSPDRTRRLSLTLNLKRRP